MAFVRGTDAVEPAAEAGRQAPGVLGKPRGGLARRNHIPNVVLTTHLGKNVKFYDDLVKDKFVVINCMYATCTDT